jgi:hypothetical protein
LPFAQTEPGVATNGADLLQALELMPSVTKAIKYRPIVQNRRVSMPGFYQFLLKSGFKEDV